MYASFDLLESRDMPAKIHSSDYYSSTNNNRYVHMHVCVCVHFLYICIYIYRDISEYRKSYIQFTLRSSLSLSQADY